MYNNYWNIYKALNGSYNVLWYNASVNFVKFFAVYTLQQMHSESGDAEAIWGNLGYNFTHISFFNSVWFDDT